MNFHNSIENLENSYSLPTKPPFSLRSSLFISFVFFLTPPVLEYFLRSSLAPALALTSFNAVNSNVANVATEECYSVCVF